MTPTLNLEVLREQSVLVTGAKGFVGSHLVNALRTAGCRVTETSSRPDVDTNTTHCDLQSDAGWKKAMQGVDVVVHLASRVHTMKDTSRNSLDAYRELNVEGSLRVGRFAAEAGVKRMVYLSSIKALGEETEEGAPFFSDQRGDPTDPYGISKAEAEDCLINQLHQTGKVEVVIIRPPLVYGKGVGGNLASLAKVVGRGVPLPFGSIKNKRDLVGIENLCDWIAVAMIHPDASGHRFVVSDGCAASTPELIRLIAELQGGNARLFCFPESVLRSLLAGMGKAEVWSRISGNLEVDLGETSRLLGWTPRNSLRDGFKNWLR